MVSALRQHLASLKAGRCLLHVFGLLAVLSWAKHWFDAPLSLLSQHMERTKFPDSFAIKLEQHSCVLPHDTQMLFEDFRHSFCSPASVWRSRIEDSDLTWQDEPASTSQLLEESFR